MGRSLLIEGRGECMWVGHSWLREGVSAGSGQDSDLKLIFNRVTKWNFLPEC